MTTDTETNPPRCRGCGWNIERPGSRAGYCSICSPRPSGCHDCGATAPDGHGC